MSPHLTELLPVLFVSFMWRKPHSTGDLELLKAPFLPLSPRQAASAYPEAAVEGHPPSANGTSTAQACQEGEPADSWLFLQAHAASASASL